MYAQYKHTHARTTYIIYMHICTYRKSAKFRVNKNSHVLSVCVKKIFVLSERLLYNLLH